MPTQGNKALVRRGFDTLNERNWIAFYELIAPDMVLHEASTTIQGLEAYKQFVSTYYTAFPDLQFSVEDLIAEGDKVVARYTGQGTHTGPLIGIAPTGQPISVTAISINLVANGKVVEPCVESGYVVPGAFLQSLRNSYRSRREYIQAGARPPE